MRASYSAAAVNLLLQNEIFFDKVYGISAGASNTANYISRDQWRAKESFVGFVTAPKFGGWGAFFTHKGYFNAHYIYQESCLPGEALEFDYDAWKANPADMCIASFERDTGKTVYWTKADMPEMQDLMIRVRASSSLPFFMPPPEIDGKRYYDGGIGEGAGLLLDKAIADGYERFFVVRTRPRGYRKDPNEKGVAPLFHQRPLLYRALKSRPARYNEVCDRLDDLERQGRAYVVYADDITATSATTNLEKLEENYRMGMDQYLRELDSWRAFLKV
ncbi:MAG: patatin family protein [bacterium]|nr:patatin family protein [bacterium]